MAKFLTIFVFIVALYTPTMVKWMNYAQCIMLTTNNADWCSCTLSNLNTTTASDSVPIASIGKLFVDDKYVPFKTTLVFSLPALKPILFASTHNKLKECLFADGVFRPPCV